MQRTFSILVFLGALTLLFGCTTDTVVSPELIQDQASTSDQPLRQAGLSEEERAILEAQGVAYSKVGDTITRVPVYTLADERRVGTSLLIRHQDGVSALLRTTELPAGVVHTLWLAFFNQPENCEDGCNTPDLQNPDVMADVVYGDGKITRLGPHASWRDAYYFTHRRVGDTSGSIFPALLGAPARGLMDAQATDVHLIVRTHGPAIPGMEDEMITSFAAGCDGFSPDLGTPGPNTCQNMQFATHDVTNVTVDRTEVQVFDPAGDYGGGVLEPGTSFPPTAGSHSTLRRGPDWVSYNLHTTGLPPGAYTNWWVVFNNPDGCVDGCDVPDLFNDTNPSVFWAAGGVVQENGIGNFHAKIGEGEVTGEFVLGNPAGLVDATGAEIHLIIKYHGPASDDPDVLYGQTHTLLGSCEEGANAWDFGPPFGVQCFDPQIAIHKP